MRLIQSRRIQTMPLPEKCWHVYVQRRGTTAREEFRTREEAHAYKRDLMVNDDRWWRIDVFKYSATVRRT